MVRGETRGNDQIRCDGLGSRFGWITPEMRNWPTYMRENVRKTHTQTHTFCHRTQRMYLPSPRLTNQIHPAPHTNDINIQWYEYRFYGDLLWNTHSSSISKVSVLNDYFHPWKQLFVSRLVITVISHTEHSVRRRLSVERPLYKWWMTDDNKIWIRVILIEEQHATVLASDCICHSC